MTFENIKIDVYEEFLLLKKSLQIFLKPDFDITQTKYFLQTHVPKEVVYKSEVLLDTLLNYLMEDAISKIKSADIEMQNLFFDKDFRQRIRDWTSQMENKLTLDSDAVQYSTDPRLQPSLIAAGVTFVVGVGITTAFVSGTLITILSGMATIILSVLAFRTVYDKTISKARVVVQQDIEQYLARSQEQVFAWLVKVAEAFESDFREFCADNDFALEERA